MRRISVVTAGWLAAVRWLAAACLAALSSGVFADWPGFRGVNNAGAATEQVVPEKLVSLKEIWRIPLGEAFSEIAVAGDKAVVFGQRGGDEAAVGLDAGTGKELWVTVIDKTLKEENGDGPRTTPAIDEGRVYVYGTFLKLYCLDLASGKEIWKHDIVGEYGGRLTGSIKTWGNAASPMVVDDVVIVEGSGVDRGILAFDKKSGVLVWGSTSEAATHATPTVATILGQKQVICFMQSGLVSVEPKGGMVLWRLAHPYKLSTGASPVVGGKNGDIVYCSAGYGVGGAACRITHEGGEWAAKPLWRTEGQNQSQWSTPVYYEGYLYGLFGQYEAKGPLACVDMETGLVRWSERGFGTQGGLIRVGDKLLVQMPTGVLVLVAASPQGYRELGRVREFGGRSWMAPAYSEGRIYARTTTEGACFEVVGK